MVVECCTEHTPQQYSAHLASFAAFGVMLRIYRDVNSHFSWSRSCDHGGGPQCYCIFTSLVRHEEVNLVLSISLTMKADYSTYLDVAY